MIIPLPLKLDVKTKKIPLITLSLIIINSTIFGLCIYFGNLEEARASYGLIPKNIYSFQKLYTLITSMFLHANISHIVGNMWFLWLFGPSIEDICGKFRYILLYLICGLIGSLLAVLVGPSSSAAIIGASGAISGIIGASMLMFSSENIKCLHPLWPFLLFYTPRQTIYTARKIIIDIPAVFWGMAWLIYQVVWIFVAASFNIVHFGYLAHFGGFFAGLFLINFIALSKPVPKKELEAESKARVIHADTPKSLMEIYTERQEKLGVAPEPLEKAAKPLLLRCKRCGEIIKITERRRPLKIRCLKCGGEGTLR